MSEMLEMCGEVLGRVGDNRRVIGKRGKMRYIIAVPPPPRVHVLVDLLACPPLSDQLFVLVKHVGLAQSVWVLLMELLFKVQVFVSLF